MGGLAQYRLSVVLFALGLLFIVSEAFGDGKKPGAIDVATKSIVKRLNSAPPGTSPSSGPYETAVAQNVADRPSGRPEAVASSDGPSDTSAAEPAGETGDLPPPSLGIIHK